MKECIYSIICHGTSLKKKILATWGLEPASLVSVNRHYYMMVECVACLLTETSDAGLSPHVAKRFFKDVP